MMNDLRRGLPALLFALLLTGCSGLDGLLGGDGSAPPPGPTTADASALRGIVFGVDTQAQTITVDETGAQAGAAYRDSQGNVRRTVLSYDGSTVVEYRGQKSNHPQGIEVGDQIEAQIERSADRLVARNIKVVASVSHGDSPSVAGVTTWDATVRSVNPTNRSIELVQSGRDQYPVTVYYQPDTPVTFEGRTYKPEELERNDGVQVRTRASGDRLMVERIVVTRNAGSAASTIPAGQPAGQRQFQATIGSVDAIARSIELLDLDTASLQHGFDKNKTTGTATVTYDDSTVVEYQGRRYGVANLERGDRVNIDLSQVGNRYLARRITVAQSR